MRWTKPRSVVESLFAPSVAGRLRIHATGYGHSTWGRSWLTWDGEEIANLSDDDAYHRRGTNMLDEPASSHRQREPRVVLSNRASSQARNSRRPAIVSKTWASGRRWLQVSHFSAPLPPRIGSSAALVSLSYRFAASIPWFVGLRSYGWPRSRGLTSRSSGPGLAVLAPAAERECLTARD